MLPKKITVQSLTGEYSINFKTLNELNNVVKKSKFIIIDKNVHEIYKDHDFIQSIKQPIFIVANEGNKNIESVKSVIRELLENGIKRGDQLVAIGGGITQDIATFVSSILFRGVKWTLIPTTLLAQCDSCIGGKSSLNFESWKNMLGNFYPPEQIIICTEFTKTLSHQEIRSGIGEIIKVHMLSGKEQSIYLEKELGSKNLEKELLERITHNSLLLKKLIIEQDEFDTGLRLKMNLGHTFGHALEAASNFQIPHGIAVNIGLLVANNFSYKSNMISPEDYKKLNDLININLKENDFSPINYESFFKALRKDKKNKKDKYCFIIPTSFGEVERKYFDMNKSSDNIIKSFLCGVFNGN